MWHPRVTVDDTSGEYNYFVLGAHPAESIYAADVRQIDPHTCDLTSVIGEFHTCMVHSKAMSVHPPPCISLTDILEAL